MYQEIDIQADHTAPAVPWGARIKKLLNTRIWLPKSIYAALPALYLIIGIYAVGAALMLSHWSWIVPYFLLLGLVSLHAGLIVAAMRWKNRHGSKTGAPRPRPDQHP